MTSIRSKARRTAVFYLLMGLPAPFNLIYMTNRFLVVGDPAATAHNIMAGETTYRLAVLAGMVSSAGFIFVALSLYDLLGDVDRWQARLMVALVAVSATIGLMCAVTEIAPLIILRAGAHLSGFTQPQLESLAYTFFRVRGAGMNVNSLLWGLWLLPLGVLVMRSGFIPRFIGMFLILGCFAYATASVTYVLFPAYFSTVTKFTLPLGAPGELCMLGWLCFRGAWLSPTLAGPSYAT